jgi:hypothetical protein
MFRSKLLMLVSLIACGTIAAALPQSARADDVDPPGRVARVNMLEGSGSLQPAGSDQWVTDVLNRPLTSGDKLWIDEKARAELHIGSSAIRVGSSTGLEIENLDDQIVQLKLTAGTLRVRVRNLGDGETFEVDTPTVSVSFIRGGDYRLDVSDSGDSTRVATISGQAAVSGGAVPYTVNPGEQGEFGGGDQATAQINPMQGRDDFDQWSEQRDRREEQSVSARYVSREVTGYEDLDDYGDWRSDPTYGQVWLPRVAVGWAPYRFGHWVWVSPWGWTWIDDVPWGFAPSHYGRWVSMHGAWGWCPGRVMVERPVYAPALVAFVGGPSFSLSISVGGPPRVGWFPLGYNEMYVPAYRVSNRYVRNVNITNTTITNTYITNNYSNNVTNARNVRYVNQSIPGAVTAVPHDAFVSARSVSEHAIPLNVRDVAGAPSSTRSLAIAPTRASLGPAPLAGRAPPRAAQNVFTRGIVAQRAPPPVVPFESQRQAIVANGARPVALHGLPSAGAISGGNASRPPVRLIRPVSGSSGPGARPAITAPAAALGSPRIGAPATPEGVTSRGIDRGQNFGVPRAPAPPRNDRPASAQPSTVSPAQAPATVVPRSIDRGQDFGVPRAPGVSRDDRPATAPSRAGDAVQAPRSVEPVSAQQPVHSDTPAPQTRRAIPAPPARVNSNALTTHDAPAAPARHDRPPGTPQAPAQAHAAPKAERAPPERRRTDKDQPAP